METGQLETSLEYKLVDRCNLDDMTQFHNITWNAIMQDASSHQPASLAPVSLLSGVTSSSILSATHFTTYQHYHTVHSLLTNMLPILYMLIYKHYLSIITCKQVHVMDSYFYKYRIITAAKPKLYVHT